MARVVIAGAGVAGLATALYLGRSGHEVVLVERDDTPLPPDPRQAFWWQRRGAPQVRHSHAFLARLRNQLRDDHPDVLEALLAAGATEMDFIQMLPEGMDRSPMAGDEDLVAIACRRTTFEWVLRRVVLDEGTATLRHGAAVSSLLTDPDRRDDTGAPAVTGIALEDATRLQADAVVLAGGRRMDLPALYRRIGAELTEHEEDTGIIYMSRFFRLHEGAEYPAQVGPIGGDLGALKFGVFPGDDRTFSITLAVDTRDAELRRLLLDPDGFLAAAALIPATAAHVDGRAEPITDVEVMGGLINRRREFIHDGVPAAVGVHAVGDAHTATNPLYGRGCSLAVVQAALLDRALSSGAAPGEIALAYEAACDAEIVPWHRAAVAQDRMSRAGSATAAPGSGGPDGRPVAEADAARTQARFMEELLREGLLPAMRVDPVVLRAFLRMFNLLEAPDSLMTDTDVLGRVMTVYQQRDQRPAEAPVGPDRDQIVAALAPEA